MKRYALHFKNIAAFLMLFALLSLLLPFCKITTGSTTDTVSGVGIIKMGAGLGYEYIKKGTIENDYEIANHLTWGDVKSGADYASKHQEVRQIALGGAVGLLPIAFLFIAMILTFLATGKVSMALPTLLTLLTVAENALMIVAFPSVQKLFVGQAGGVSLSLLIGIYAFTLLAAIALAIIIMLWVTGGFNRPENWERDSDNGKDKSKKKSRFSRRDKGRKKRRRRRKSGRKGKKKARGSKESEPQKTNQASEQPKEEKAEQKQEEVPVITAANGHVSGLAGMYQGTDLDLSSDGNGVFTIGTTAEAKEIILTGTLAEAHKLEGCNCSIKYDAVSKHYTITSHSIQDIILQIGNSQRQIRLRQGEGTTVGGNTLLFIGDLSNIIKLD